jgi:hypothetical protein
MSRMYAQSACLATIPASKMHNTPVYLVADMSPVTDTAITLQADLMAQDVAEELRALVDSTHGAMPNADGKLPWYSVPAQIIVTVHADGPESWRENNADGNSSVAQLIGAALDSARAHKSTRILFPEGTHSDSMLVRLSLMPKYTGYAEQNPEGAKHETKFGVFYLAEPDVTLALPKPDWPPPDYPSANESARVQGDVLIEFIVDSTGRTDPNSFRDIWPADKPRLHGYEAQYYDAFVSSLRKWEKILTFEPMRIGGCPVRQTVRLPLTFMAPGSR